MEMLNEINNVIISPHFNLSEFACPCCNLVMLYAAFQAAYQISGIKKFPGKAGVYYLRIPML
jgi:hypothetical protein